MSTAPEYSINIIDQFSARDSDDIVKSDLELTCDFCDAIVCDIEAGDNLLVLVKTALDHLDECPAAGGDA